MFVGLASLHPSESCQAGPSRLPSVSRRHLSSSIRVGRTKPPSHGQPLSSTHPQLIRPGELTAGIQAEEYERRRQKLMSSLPEGSVVVGMGGTVRLMSQCEYQSNRAAIALLRMKA